MSEEVAALLREPNILAKVEEQMRARGLAGDATASLLAELALVSRHLERPINLSGIGEPGTGKNQKFQYAVDLHPRCAFYPISAASPRALIYLEDSLQHRIVVMAEADSIADDGSGASAMRSLIEDARLIYDTVLDGKHVQIVKEGPTGLITTGTQPLAPQLRTRVLEVRLDPTPEEVDEELDAIGLEAEGSIEPREDRRVVFVALHAWIANHGDREVVVPFARALGKSLVHTPDVKRRFKLILSAIKACALLHQVQRNRDSKGRIIATLDDYEMVRPLLQRAMPQPDSLSVAELKTLAALDPVTPMSLTELARKLVKKKSTLSPTVRSLEKKGFVRNLDPSPGREDKLIRLRLGQLPEAAELGAHDGAPAASPVVESAPTSAVLALADLYSTINA